MNAEYETLVRKIKVSKKKKKKWVRAGRPAGVEFDYLAIISLKNQGTRSIHSTETSCVPNQIVSC